MLSKFSAVLVVVLLVMAGGVVQANATTYSCSSQVGGNYFAGYVTSANSGKVGAAASVMVRPSASYCVGHYGNFSSTWVMTASVYSDGYAQAGFDTALCGSGGCGSLASPHYFTQAKKNSWTNAETWVGPLAPVGNSQLFWAWSDTNCGCAIMAIGLGTYVSSTSWSPFAEWSGSQSQFLNEASDRADHIAGTLSARVDYTSMSELQFLGSWSGSLAPLTRVNDSVYLWGVTTAATCPNGYQCFSSWANP